MFWYTVALSALVFALFKSDLGSGPASCVRALMLLYTMFVRLAPQPSALE